MNSKNNLKQKICLLIVLSMVVFIQSLTARVNSLNLLAKLDRGVASNLTNVKDMGREVATIGDINSDGYDDWAIGLYDATDYETGEVIGKVYIYLGDNTINDDQTPDLILTGENSGGKFGWKVSSAGDVNSDGFDDIIVGAYQANDFTGRAYIYLGGNSPDSIADITITGEYADDCFGWTLSSAGDLNNDGFGDIVVGAYGYDGEGTDKGRAYIYLGGTNMDNIVDITITGEYDYYRLGGSISSAGDVNNDGFDDIIVGRRIYFGGTNMDAIVDVEFTEGLSGSEDNLSSAGDVNNDGFDDIIVGASRRYLAGSSVAYIYLGGTNMDNIADITMTGEDEWGYLGWSVSSAGDVNSDGFDDVIVGYDLSDAGVVEGGQAYIYFGGATMDSIPDITITGKDEWGRLGRSVSSAGDVNSDGFDDVIVGANAYSKGKVYIYLGGINMDSIADATTFTRGSSGDYFGRSVSSAGDINSDGFDDLIVGAEYNDAGGTDAGKAYIYLGGNNPNNVADITLSGEDKWDCFGHSVSSAGDVNSDGFDDIIVGAYQANDFTGRAYIYFGGTNPDTVPAIVFTEEKSSSSAFGCSVSSAGDVNSDGFDDIIVGAPGGNSTGWSYIYFGGADPDTIPDVVLAGENRDDYFGGSVSSAGDVNSDGFDDVIVGASSNETGRAYIYFGGNNMDTIPDVVLAGENRDDLFGCSVSAVGDMNSDGFDDVIVGATFNDAGGNNAGRCYIYFGGTNPDSIADVVLTGENTDDRLGVGISSAGDMNNDGFDDIIVGATFNDAGGNNAGRSYIYFGGTNPDTIPDIVLAGECADDGFGISVASAGDINNDGFNEIIIGALQNSAAGYQMGRAYIYEQSPRLSASPDTLTVSATNGADTIQVSNRGPGEIQWQAAVPEEYNNWLTITGGVSGTNNGTVTVNCENNTSNERTGKIVITTVVGVINSPDTIIVNQSAGDPVLSVTPTGLNVLKESSTTTFDISNTGGGILNWTAIENVDWFSIDPAAGTNSAVITVSYTANTSDARSDTITVTDTDGYNAPVKVVVNQEAADPVLTVLPAQRNVSPASGTTTFDVSNTGGGILNWTVVENVDWFSIDPVTGTNSATITVSYSVNTGDARSDTITVTDDDGYNNPVKVVVSQAENTCPVWLSLHDTIAIGQIENYQTSDSIIAAGNGTCYIIEANGTNGGDVTMGASTIVMYPGFDAPKGAVFLAQISPCSGADLKSMDYISGSAGGNEMVVKLFPNPTNGELNILLQKQNDAMATIEVMDLMGNSIYRVQTKANSATIDLSQQSPGLYVVKVMQGNQLVVHKVIKQ